MRPLIWLCLLSTVGHASATGNTSTMTPGCPHPCNVGFYCSAKDSQCKFSPEMILAVILSCLMLVLLLPFATMLLLYCTGVACNVHWINNCFERWYHRIRRSLIGERRLRHNKLSGLQSRRKRQVRKFLQSKERKCSRKGRRIQDKKFKASYPVRSSAVFVRASAIRDSTKTNRQRSIEHFRQPAKDKSESLLIAKEPENAVTDQMQMTQFGSIKTPRSSKCDLAN